MPIPTLPTLDPRELYLQALEMRRRKKNYIGADEIPMAQPPVTPTSYSEVLPTISRYASIQPEDNAPPLPPVPTAPTLPVPAQAVPETSTLDKMNQTQGKVELPPPPEPEKPPDEGFISKLGRGAVAGLSELFKGIRMGPKGYEAHQQYLERLPYEREDEETRRKSEATEFDRRLALTRANETPQTQLAQMTLDAKNAFLAGTATPEQIALINEGVKKEDTGKIEKGALLHFTNTKKWGSNKGGFEKAKAQFQLLEPSMREKGIDTAVLWQQIAKYWQDQVGTGLLGTGLLSRTYE